MSLGKRLHEAATRNMRGGKKRESAGSVSVTTFSKDMQLLIEDMTGSQLLQANKRMSKILRDEIVKVLKLGSSAERIGRSQYDRTTRGDWKRPRTTEGGVSYLRGGWYGETLDARGPKKPTMAYNGGNTKTNNGGKRGIITKTLSRRAKGWYSATGPRYGTDDEDNSRYGYNYAHMLEYGGRHKAWGNDIGNFIPRPFMKPAAAVAYSKQNALLKQMLIKWGKFS